MAIGLGLWLGLGTARGAIQFDVFLGYGSQPTGADGVVHEVGWFAVGCEVLNDGPGFNATVEVSSAQFGGGQTRRLNVELPTNTRKRFGLPAFLGLNAYATWDARLLDERGRVRAELRNLRPRMVSWEGLLVAAVPRSFGGSPKFPPLKGNNAQSAIQPLVARMAVEQVPDDPIALEGLNALYLNSEKAVELKAGQADALSAWVWGGGHLVLAVEQPADLAAAPWLRRLAPVDFSRVVSAKPGPALHRWLVLPADQGFHIDLEEAAPEGMPQQVAPPQYRGPGSTKPGSGPADGGLYHNLEPDKSIEPVEFPVAVGRIRDGQVELALGDTPLIIRVQRGRGMVTILAFSPEREPFRSWKHRDWFWVRLLAPPAMWFGAQQFMTWGGTSVDGVFGGMIDSTQVRKLPVPALLLLLVVYLVVIGPLDHYVLKRLNRTGIPLVSSVASRRFVRNAKPTPTVLPAGPMMKTASCAASVAGFQTRLAGQMGSGAVRQFERMSIWAVR